MPETQADPGCDVCQTVLDVENGDLYLHIESPAEIVNVCSWACAAEHCARKSREFFQQLWAERVARSSAER